ncbi:MAG TPA: gephyrin-like molybdotransferase Glp [Pirellula sp.]|nr:gephyrin-like molybdotransferase Glp [Pirellula sp.]
MTLLFMNMPPLPFDKSDVRMKGFAKRSTVEAATEWIDSALPDYSSLPIESVSLFHASGRVLATKVNSSFNVPGFTRSMMDGFAIRAEETLGATAYNALSFLIVGNSFPGMPYSGTVLSGQAVRIMTGAPMPGGADAVIPVEHTETQTCTVLVMGEVSVGKHVGIVGEDVSRGSVVFEAGRMLRPQDIGVLSSIGCDTLPVIRRPIVRIVITGNEILPAGTRPHGFQIADANGPMLHSLVTRDGGLPVISGLVPDDHESLLAAMSEPADVVLVSGGSSVGEEDHAPRVLAEHGTLAIHGIAMRPSSPTGMGIFNQRLVFLLPGNPVSTLCAYDFFAGRAIRALGGRSKDWPYRRVQATLTRKLVSTVGRVDYARVKLVGKHAEPVAISGASVLTSTTQADGFVIIQADSEGYAAQSLVDVLTY